MESSGKPISSNASQLHVNTAGKHNLLPEGNTIGVGIIPEVVHIEEANMQALIYSSFVILGMISVAIQALAMKTKPQLSSGNNPHFRQFQRKFFAVYFLALFSDWLQGPYVYKLYSYYGFAENQIAILYVVGFAASVIFGTATGPLADRFGRKKMCIAFSILYSVCCLTKMSSNFYILLIGRILGGISTSMLFSSFEAWYVYEHTVHFDFPPEWISVTFAKVTFWNGFLAIIAGVLSNFMVEWLDWGPLVPFLLAVPFLVMCGIVVCNSWEENYGNQNMKLCNSCVEGLRRILSKDTILQLGFIQSLFEAVMYMFVFLWTPVLDSSRPPLGMIFSCFMVCIMIGSSLYALLLAQKFSSEKVLTLSTILALLCTSTCVISTSPGNPLPDISFIAFLVLEVAIGLYFPAAGYLRSQVVPEELRANITNWFRLPMNLMTCSGLLWLKGDESKQHSQNRTMFAMCSVLLVGATLLSVRFSRRYEEEHKQKSSLLEEMES